MRVPPHRPASPRTGWVCPRPRAMPCDAMRPPHTSGAGRGGGAPPDKGGGGGGGGGGGRVPPLPYIWAPASRARLRSAPSPCSVPFVSLPAPFSPPTSGRSGAKSLPRRRTFPRWKFGRIQSTAPQRRSDTERGSAHPTPNRRSAASVGDGHRPHRAPAAMRPSERPPSPPPIPTGVGAALGPPPGVPRDRPQAVGGTQRAPPRGSAGPPLGFTLPRRSDAPIAELLPTDNGPGDAPPKGGSGSG